MTAQPDPSPGPAHPASERVPGDPAPPPDERGQDEGSEGLARVGPYRLLARIGEGGMGVVHLAQTPDGRRVALKVLRPHVVGDAEARERLAREVSSLRRVTSPRVAEVLDADPLGPVPYVVTRYVPGLSLFHHVAEEGELVGRDLLHFADCLAEALQAVHSVGVLHRDVKPTNVLMEGRSPVLIDFGLARVADDPRLTQTGFLLGTPGYLAPEILYGEDATAAADVHAWAATVAFAATGRPPYGRGPAMGVLDRVRRGQHDLTGVPDDLAALLADALRPEAWERPLLAEIREWLAEHRIPRPVEPVSERELWTMPVHPMRATPPSQADDSTPATRVAPLLAPVPPPAPAPVSQPVLPPVQPVQAPVLPPPAGADRPALHPVPHTRVMRAEAPATPAEKPFPTGLPRQPSRWQRVFQMLGLGALTAALVAYAPYAGTALVAVVVLLLRTLSITRQRHDTRKFVRGRARWYDVPTTALALPFYVVLALVGTVGVVLGGAIAGAAMLSLGYLLGQSTEVSLVLAGLGFAPALWWGPFSGRVRERTRRFTSRTARTDLGGWFVAGVCVVSALALLGVLLGDGPNWAPYVSPPWQGLR